jgi:formylglycine-generating enzyme required for sulfatase activity
MDPKSCRLAPVLLVALLCGCQTASGEPRPQPAPTAAPPGSGAQMASPTGTGQATSTASAAMAPSGPSSAGAASAGQVGSGAGNALGAPAPEQAPCAGKAAGEHACDGARLVVCAEGGVAKEVQTCLDIERCDAQQKACAPACPEGEVYIPATGPEGFKMGRGYLAREGHAKFGKGHLPDSDRPHNVVLTKPFCMEEHEVTVGQLIPWVEAGKSAPPHVGRNFVTYPKLVDHPVNSYSWPEAKSFCEGHGKSLPTEAQWEWAAGGRDGKVYPWGDEAPSCELADYTPGVLPRPSANAGCHGGGPSAVGAHPAGDRIWPTGHLHDMAGNVWEWCLDNYKPYSGKDEVDPNHLENDTQVHVVRGGGWNRSGDGIRVSFRGGARYDYWVPGLGFRCVRNPK